MPYVELLDGKCPECQGIHPVQISFPTQNYSFELPGQRPEWSDELLSRICSFFYAQSMQFCYKSPKQIKDLLYRNAHDPHANPEGLQIEEILQPQTNIVILIS